MRPLPAGLALALLLAPLGCARADFLYSRLVEAGGGVPDILPGVRVRLVITPDPHDDWLSPLLDVTLTPADVGKTFVADAASPHFATSAAWLTDGLDGRVFLAFEPGAHGWYEKGFFYYAPHEPSPTGPFDLKGATLSQVKLLVTDLQLTPPGPDRPWTGFAFKGVVTFEGQPPPPGSPEAIGLGLGSPEPVGSGVSEAPEPNSLALALGGVLGMFGLARRRRKRWRPGC